MPGAFCRPLLALFAVSLLAACPPPPSDPAPPVNPGRTGGSSGMSTGGTGPAGTGGMTATGGSPAATGGTIATGGAPGTGGSGTGGSVEGTGGAPTAPDAPVEAATEAGPASDGGKPSFGGEPVADRPWVFLCPKAWDQAQCCDLLCKCMGDRCVDSPQDQPRLASCMSTCMKESLMRVRCQVYHCFESDNPRFQRDHNSHCGHASGRVAGGGCGPVEQQK